MKLLNKLVFYFYYEILIEIFNDEFLCKKTFNSFYISLNSLSKFYLIVIFFYQIFVNFIALLLKIIFFLNNKKNSNLFLFEIIKKLPVFKNINNFLFANLLLHHNDQ